MNPGTILRLTAEQFEAIISRAMDLLPPEIGRVITNMAVIVEERPTRRDLAEVGLSHWDSLFGLFRGIPITEQSFFSPGGNLPHQIVLFKAELEDHCATPAELVYEITMTLIHEVGHYLGLGEEDLIRLEAEAGRNRPRTNTTEDLT